MTDKDYDYDAEEEQPKSKTQIKNEMAALQALGIKLIELNEKQLATVPLDDKLHKAISEARNMRHREGRRRQLQFIGKLMRAADGEAIEAAYDKLMDKDKQHIQRQHQMEKWRDRLLEEADKAIGDFLNEFPDSDRQHMRNLIREAVKEKKHDKPPAHARKLFRYIRETMESEDEE